jgi:transposase
MNSSILYAAGVDVGAETLSLVIRKQGVGRKAQRFDNTPSDRARLVDKLRGLPGVTVCLEATGVYSLDLTIALHDAGLRVMALNPQVAHNFAKVLSRGGKTDDLDADMLAQYAERMPFQAWTRPTNAALGLRALSRRINALTKQKAMAKNQQHAAAFAADATAGVLDDLTLAIEQLEARIKTLTEKARALIEQEPALNARFALLLGIKGVGETSAIALLGELALAPPHLTHKQWVKWAGLNPSAFQSGKSIDKKARLSKAGNRYIRQALYMPALSARVHDPHVRAYAEHLIAKGKLPMQAICAVMRKLLHAIHGMFKDNLPFDNTRFYDLKTAKIAGQ